MVMERFPVGFLGWSIDGARAQLAHKRYGEVMERLRCHRRHIDLFSIDLPAERSTLAQQALQGDTKPLSSAW